MSNILPLISLLLALSFSHVQAQCSAVNDNEYKIHFSTGWAMTTRPDNFADRTEVEFQGLRLWIAPNTGKLQVLEVSSGVVLWSWGKDGRNCSTINSCDISFSYDGNFKFYYSYISADDKVLSNTYNNVGRTLRFSTSPPYFEILDVNCTLAWPKDPTSLKVTIVPRTTSVNGAILQVVNATVKALPVTKWKSSFGMNTHIGQGWIPSQVYTMATYMGVGIIRDRSPSASKYPDFQRMRDAGIKAMFSVVKPANKSDLAVQVQAISDFQTAVPGMLAIVEGFNEINNFKFTYNGINPATTYAGMFQAQKDLYSLVKSTSNLKDFPVADLNGGCNLDGPSLGCSNITGRADLANIHNYPFGGQQPVSVGVGARDIFTFGGYSNFFDNTKTVLGETGYHTDKFIDASLPEGVTLSAQAILVVNAILGGIKFGIGNTFIYEMLDEGATRDNRENNFGVFYNNRTPKPAATAFHFLSGLLNDITTVTSLQTVSLSFKNLPYSADYLLFQHSSGKFFLVLYNTAPVYNPATQSDILFNIVQVTLTLPYTTTLSVYDIYSTTANDTIPLPPQSSTSGSSITFGFGSQAKVISFGTKN